MKVLHIISSGGMYGAEAVILNLSRMLIEDGHSSVIGVFSNSSNPNLQLHERATSDGLESHLIPCHGQLDRAAVAAIRELALRSAADVVHAHGFKADIYAHLALRGTRVPLVSTCHTWYDNDLLVTLYGKLDRFVLRKFARVVAVSDEVKNILLESGVRADRICMVHNGIDLRPFRGVAPSLRGDGPELLVGLVGRLAREKGVDVFLAAAARVLRELPGARFVVVGEGPDREKLDRTVDELKVGENVKMLGRRDDMPAVYASLDIMVSSSRQEGLPMAILEGMASGLPLVASAVGEVPTVVRDGVTGLLVPADHVEQLAAGILELLRDEAKRKRFGAAARKLIEDEYSAERMTADYLRVYEEAIAAVKQ
ncbi:MAG: glycosyltransferase family 4 protein [Acidobacteriota bacterium]|nr:glycosyltransferase family 4 protein [Acidobacteriota bacterium]